MQRGDFLRSHNGRTVVVDGVYDSGVVEEVYNFRVEEHHTYFVGGKDWGFSVWAHNACEGTTRRAQQADLVEQNGISIKRFPPGNVSSESSYLYALTRDGQVIHYGTTNDPANRLRQHMQRFGPNVEMEVLSGPHPTPIAVDMQNQLIDTYQGLFGQRPIGNLIRN